MVSSGIRSGSLIWGPIEEEPEQDELIRYHKGNKPKTAFYNPGPTGSHFRHEARGTRPVACSPEVCAVGQRNGRFPHGTTAGSTVATEEIGGSEFDLREYGKGLVVGYPRGQHEKPRAHKCS